MNIGEAKRLALLIILDDTERGLDVSDEWISHPETNVPFTREECAQVKAQGALLAKELQRRAWRLESTRSTRCLREIVKTEPLPPKDPRFPGNARQRLTLSCGHVV